MKYETLYGRGATPGQAAADLNTQYIEWTDNPLGVIIKQSDDPIDFDESRAQYVCRRHLSFEMMQKKSDYLQLGWRATKGPQESNKSGFRACGHRVLLSPDEVEEVTEGGIVLVKKTQVAEKNMAVVCTVLEIGHDCWTDKSTDYCQVGDRVLIGTYTGKFHISPVDGKEYRFVMDTDIISPIPKDPA